MKTFEYSVDIGNGIYRSPLAKDKLLDNTTDSIYDRFIRGEKLSENGNCYGTFNATTEQFDWLTYGQVHEVVEKAGSALAKLVAKGTSVGIYSLNRKEWPIAELGCFRNGMITVPLYDTLGKEAIIHIINESEMKIAVLSKNRIKGLIDIKKEGAIKSLLQLVAMENVDDELKTQASAVGITLLGWDEFIKLGEENKTDDSNKQKNGDVATICYTSGTSGMPKGVVLTHRNIINMADALEVMGKNGVFYTFSKNDVHLSYLPLAHVFERVLDVVMINVGAQIAFYRGDPLKILDDVKVLKPTVFVSVPRLFNRIYDKVWQGVNDKSMIAKFLFKLAYNQKKVGLAEGAVTHWLWDKLVFGKVRERLGFGRCSLMFSGSAPISPDVMDFLRIVFCCEALEGYGQTESSAGVAVSQWGDTSGGHIGGPVPVVELKLHDLPEMDYTTKDKPHPRGEICYRGSSAFTEYYKQPEKTKETIDKDGWVHTGDVGCIDDKGRLKIIDRAKNIFKLAQGEYVAPEKIEGVYIKHELLAQMFVYGDSLQPALVAIAVPDKEPFEKWAKANSFQGGLAELVKNPTVTKKVLEEITAYARSSDLKGFEIVRAIKLDSEMFSVDNDLLTPTFKLKRHEAKKKYKDDIAKLYAELGDK